MVGNLPIHGWWIFYGCSLEVFNSEFTPGKIDGLEDELAEFPFGVLVTFRGRAVKLQG